jgi:hypothetical protein
MKSDHGLTPLVLRFLDTGKRTVTHIFINV